MRKNGRQPEARAAAIRHAFEKYDFMEEHSPLDWPMPEALRTIATAMGVPYLLLLLDLYAHCSPQMVRLEDVDAFNADPAARVVLLERLAETEKAAVA
jgi:hypothetical protein